jgi:hypothetical protein
MAPSLALLYASLTFSIGHSYTFAISSGFFFPEVTKMAGT